MNSSFKLFLLIAAAAFVAWSVGQAEAQSPWQGFSRQSSVAMRYMRLHFKSDDYLKANGSLLVLDIATRRSESGALIVNVPLAYFRGRYEYHYTGTEKWRSRVLFGNPYFGARVLSDVPFLSFDFGLRLPVTVDSEFDAAISGTLSDIDQMEAFIHNYLPIHCGLSIDMKSEEGLFIRTKIDPCIWIYVGKSKYVDFTELVLHFGAITGIENQIIRLQGGISGMSILSEKDAFADETSMHQLGLEMRFRTGNLWPGIHFRWPLDYDINEIVDRVWGISIMYEGE